MSKPALKGNFTQTLILFAAIFLLMQLFMQSRGPADTRPAEEYMKAVRTEVETIKSDAARRSVSVDTIVREMEGQSKAIQLRLHVPSINADQAEEVLRYQNELGLDMTAGQYLSFVQGKISEQAEKEKWDPAKKKQAEIEAIVARRSTKKSGLFPV